MNPEFSPTAIRTQRQLIIFVLDKSPSMSEETLGGVSKIQALANVMKDLLLTRLKRSRIVQNFDIAVVNFADTASVELQTTPLVNLPENFSIQSSTYGSGTNMTQALEEVQRIWTQYNSIQSELKTSAVALLVTDGEPNIRQGELTDIASNLKSQGVTIACCLLPSLDSRQDQARDLMKKIVTDASYFTEARDAETLRNFFLRSISSATGTKV
jgi:uncharacterized protein YegL